MNEETYTTDKGYAPLSEIIEHVRRYHPNDDVSVIEKAYCFAEQAHMGQKRMSGEAYFAHPCAVAIILADLMLDPPTIAGGLLHDCVEDVESVTVQTIEKRFGSEIALMVDGVTKLTRIDYSSREERQAESLRKMLLAMAKDIRVVLIKLADRLHNMRTLKTQKPERQIPIAKETLDIYAPLAHRLGVYAVKWELEDLALRYIDPEGYYLLVEKVGMKRGEREKWIQSIIETLKKKLDEEGIHNEIDGRPKHFYSIYKKMKTQGKTFEQINDLIAVRVIVDTKQDCYWALGVAHSLWPQVPNRFKDYISNPKNNSYQSLHTTVVGTDGKPFEVQIRTREMHRTAEYGIAAHWRYKEGKAADSMDEKLGWLRRILEWQSETGDPNQFKDFLTGDLDLFAEEVLVFTPKGDVITLPKGSSPLDFAYRIHSAIGDRCVGAKINHRIVPIATPLETGDFVEIMTSANSRGPSLDWLSIVKTSEAKTKIRSFLKNVSRDENIQRGHELLEKDAKRLGYQFPQLCKTEYLDVLFKRYSLSSLDDLYLTVGFGGLSAPHVINRLADEHRKATKPEPVKASEVVETPQPRQSSGSGQGVIVEGDPGMLVRFARCCNPLPGDSIIGYVTRGRGVSVHRADCVNMQDEGVEPERMVKVAWEGTSQGSYEADIQVIGYDKAGLIADLSSLFSDLEVPIVAIVARNLKNSTAQITLTLSIKNTTQLENIIKRLRKRIDIIEVFRVSS